MTNIQKLRLILNTPQLQQLRELTEQTDGYFKLITDPEFESPQIFTKVGNFEGVIRLQFWNGTYQTIAPSFHQPLTTEWFSDEEDSAFMIFSTLHKLCRADKLKKDLKPFELKYSDQFITSDPIPSDWQFEY